MKLPVDFLRAARRELVEAAIWYENQHANLGTDFILEIDRCLGVIAEQPELFALTHKDVRRITVKRFPYSIYFRTTAERILVLAVFHHRRSPAVWQRRI
ncbi:Plasmid stabilization system protein [Thiorhodovibrio winogradskyi]|uniref:Plasmid stabilization system protein n=1 Tax=Thiorhodovibrio winogradskyi TaxID=77007 RepID=A0ABZ0SGF2_9GAMM|nr:type II toxin-antitoxin system RelE/ParE family toxin [Thiorhodovibrio winogradskyi]